jgi:hypothetical protein
MKEVYGERAQGRDVRGEGERVVVAGVGSPLSQVHKIYARTHIAIHCAYYIFAEACVNIRTGPGKLYASVHTHTQARANGPNRPKTAAPAVGHHGSWAGVAVPRKEVTVTPAGGTYGVVSLCMRV